MTRRTIGGVLDYRLLAQLHRPVSQQQLAVEARRLHHQGLQPQDIGEALGMAPEAIRQLLGRQEARQLPVQPRNAPEKLTPNEDD